MRANLARLCYFLFFGLFAAVSVLALVGTTRLGLLQPVVLAYGVASVFILRPVRAVAASRGAMMLVFHYRLSSVSG